MKLKSKIKDAISKNDFCQLENVLEGIKVLRSRSGTILIFWYMVPDTASFLIFPPTTIKDGQRASKRQDMQLIRNTHPC